MKQKTKTITAISCTIAGHTTYISGQSTREFDSKYIPQYNPDPVHATEFENEEHANEYLQKVVNNLHRKYDVVQIEIPIIRDLKKYDRAKRNEAKQHQPVRRAFFKETLAAIIFIAIVLVSCRSTCPANTPGYEPQPKHKKFTA